MSKYKRKKIVLLTSSDDSDDSDEVIFINESDKPNKKTRKLKNANADEAKGRSSNDGGKKANTSKTPLTQKITPFNSASTSKSTAKNTTTSKVSSKTKEEGSVACTVADCTKVFANHINMIKHRSKVHRAKSNVCQVCSAAFKFPYELKRHRLIHSQNNPLQVTSFCCLHQCQLNFTLVSF